ncbi:MAG: hypothetical protein QOK48_2209 [Blastocatellia bacterium]|nr:hypothetical protein [Blastocatellia bacterium]
MLLKQTWANHLLLVFADQVLYSQIVSPPVEVFPGLR